MAYNVRLRARPDGRSVALMLNAHARQVTGKLRDQLEPHIGTQHLYFSDDLANSRQLADHLVRSGYEAVVAGGGDGTFTHLVSDLHAAAAKQGRQPPAVGILRLGTGNAVAETLGIDRKRAHSEVIASARRSETRPMRLLNVDGRLSPFAGVGLDAQILEDYRATTGMLAHVGLDGISSEARYALTIALRTIPRFAFRRRTIVTAVNLGSPALCIGPDGKLSGKTIPAGEVLYQGPASLASGSTIPFYGLGLKMFPHVDLAPGRFQLRLAGCSTLEILPNIGRLFAGTFHSPRMHDFLVDKVALYCDDETPFQIGGDLVGRRRTITLQLSPTIVETVS